MDYPSPQEYKEIWSVCIDINAVVIKEHTLKNVIQKPIIQNIWNVLVHVLILITFFSAHRIVHM